MAYGEKYKYYFYWDHDDTKNYYKVSFLIQGYASTVTELTAGPSPFVKRYVGQKDSINQIIYGSEGSMEIIVNNTDVDVIDPDLLSIVYKDVIVKLIKDPDGTPTTEWTGILLPQSSDREYLGFKMTYVLKAVDGLADLKNYKFTTDGKDTGSPYQGFETMLAILKRSISKVADFTELQLDFRIQLGTFSNLMTSTENAIKENEVVQDIFNRDNNDKLEFDTCYEVLEKILKPFSCVMAQVDGHYWIWCKGERDSFYFEYDWTTLTEQSRTANNRTIEFQGASSGYELFGRGSLSKIAPLSDLLTTLFNKEYTPELITNGTFDTNITGWTNGDADDNSNQFTGIVFDDLAGKGGTLEATWAGAATAGFYNFHAGNASIMTVGGGAGTVTVFYSVQFTSSTPSGLDNPKVKTRLYNATDGYTASTLGQRTISTFGAFFNFIDTFDVTGLTVANNFLDIEIEITDASTTQATFNIDDISMNQTSINEPADWLYTTTPTSGTAYKDSEIELYISDSQESISDSCSIKDAGGNYTSTWDRFGETDTLKLIAILSQYHLNANNEFKDYITCKAYDPDETIQINNTLFDRALGLDARYYDIIGLTINYRDATLNIQAKQNGLLTADVTYNEWREKLKTQFGNTIE